MTRISAFTGGFSGYRSVSRSFAAGGGEVSEYANATMIFVQTSAPTGWTKVTTYDDYALRIVSGSVNTGGSVNFSSVFTSLTPTGTTTSATLGAATDSTILTVSQIPGHTHTFPGNGPLMTSGPGPGNRSPWNDVGSTGVVGGSGSGHAHPSGGTVTTSFSGNNIDMSIKYVDCILATKA
jgi:hypothetical protein